MTSYLLLILSLLFAYCITSVSAEVHAEVVVVFLFTALFVGAAITYGLTRLAPSVPYTVVVFGFGTLIGVLFTPIASENVMKQSESMWNNIDPNLILYLFLPALLFGEAMSLSIHHVRGAIVPAGVLAGPGALFGALLTACIAKGCLPYSWSWPLCLIFGSILCATDPVAVVALLKSCGASHKLTYLVIGEALMNDGTALVLYNMLFSTVQAGSHPALTALGVFLYFLKVIFVSPLLGGAFGLGSVLCLSLTTQRMSEADTTVQMAVTVCCAYLSFFVAEYCLEVSGVLCCCAAALVLARFANPLILRPETLHSIWAAFEWIGNTLIFTLAGLIFGARTFAYMYPSDVVFSLVMYAFTFIVRALTVWVCMPVLRSPRCGKVVSNAEAVFATWGGLRGAVSMALALSLVHSTERGETQLSEHDSHRVFFLVGGVAALTLMVNATTAGAALNRLGLLEETSASPEHQVVLRYIRRRIRARALQMLSQLRKMRRDRIDPIRLYHYCSVLREEADGTGLDKGTEIGDGAQEFARQWQDDGGPGALLASMEPTSPAPFMRKTGRSLSDDAISGSLSVPILGGEGPAMIPLKGALRRRPPTSTVPTAHPFAPASPPAASPRPYSPVNRCEPAGDSATSAEQMREEGSGKQEGTDSERDQQVRPRRVSWSLDHAAGERERVRTLSSENSPLHCGWEEGELRENCTVSPTLLSGTRRAFLEIVRMAYWKQINSNQLPRKSTVALLLLGSVDVALESTGTPGLQDWEHILPQFQYLYSNDHSNAGRPSNGSKRLPPVYSRPTQQPQSATLSLERLNKGIRSYRDGQAVYLLTAFIDAHIYAQQRIAYCMGTTTAVDTPEQEVVVLESQALVEQARDRLAAIDPETVTKQVTKQTARWVIHEQQEQTEQYLREGVVSAAEAEKLLREAEGDLRRLGKVEWTDVLLRALGALCRASTSRKEALVRHSQRQKEAVSEFLKKAQRSLSGSDKASDSTGDEETGH